MPNVRPLNKKKYGISKHAFGTAYSYCLQYPEWREELGSRTSTVKSPQITGMPGAHSGSDATANLAERRVELREKMQKVEDTVREAVGDNKSLYEYLLEYVTTEGATFHWMKQKGIPCERTYFYEVRITSWQSGSESAVLTGQLLCYIDKVQKMRTKILRHYPSQRLRKTRSFFRWRRHDTRTD